MQTEMVLRLNTVRNTNDLPELKREARPTLSVVICMYLPVSCCFTFAHVEEQSAIACMRFGAFQ